MKTYLLLFTLLGFTALTGCSADDLPGPDALADDPLAQSTSDEAVRTSRALVGAWRASDRLGSVTLFLDDTNGPPPSSPSAAQSFDGKGIISGLLEAPFAVSVESQYKSPAIAFALTDARGEPIAKAQGAIATDFSEIKVVLVDEHGQQRDLVFERF